MCRCAILMALLSVTVAVRAQESPVDIDQEEKVKVRLVLVDILVTDRNGRTVPGLDIQDFTLLVQNRPVAIDTLDAVCAAGGRDDPGPRVADSEPLTGIPDSPARVVLLFDHYHMDMGDRLDAQRHAREIIAGGIGPEDRLMVAVLSDGLRILQPFTSDPVRLYSALNRMEQDVTLWAKLFDPPYRPLTEKGYFRDLSRLMNVLIGYEGSKAVVMFSAFLGRSDDNDLWYLDVAHRAAEGRAVIYPVYARGLTPPLRGRKTEPVGGSRALARLANETGGRFTRNTNDLSLGYVRARRDLTCRYTVGFYLEETGRNQVEDSRNITVRVRGRGRSVRHPEQLREWSAEDRKRAAVSAAEADPERFLDPAVRSGLRLVRPKGERNWKVHLEAEAPPPDETAAMTVLVTRNRKTVKRFQQVVPRGRPVRWSRSTNLPAGEYELIVVLDDPGRSGPSTTVTAISVPEPVSPG